MSIITIIGARPQFIKAAVVSRALAARGVAEKLLHTGQHFDANMSDVFFEELEIPRPAYHLGIGGGTHGQNTGRMVEAIEKVLLDQRPDWVLVYGDTDSTLAGAVSAVKLHIPVAHVEAGLRSFNRRMPEEINRVLTDHAASLLFAPTDVAVGHLVNEGISGASVCQVGDVMYDAALFYGEKAGHSST
ncbi:MAG: UDP-N-acetylglucosamine 2-epimerase, partial [Azoarcus sp.]|nr:UDP-N-acetylglucosamine 2-epimerase [Azoarcus sp.]